MPPDRPWCRAISRCSRTRSSRDGLQDQPALLPTRGAHQRAQQRRDPGHRRTTGGRRRVIAGHRSRPERSRHPDSARHGTVVGCAGCAGIGTAMTGGFFFVVRSCPVNGRTDPPDCSDRARHRGADHGLYLASASLRPALVGGLDICRAAHLGQRPDVLPKGNQSALKAT
jgi:hypothetical protein